jgi:Ca2+:H+ antiporter
LSDAATSGPTVTRGTIFGICAAFAAAALLGVLHYTTDSAVLQFMVGIVALALLAWTVGAGTEAVGARFGPAATGVLQSTLGNLPELFIVIFALKAGEIVVAQTSIIGSVLANALLVLGLAIAAGTWRARHADGVMRFHRRLPNDTATLLLLVVFMIVLLNTSTSFGRETEHVVAISVVGAVLILSVYVAWLHSYLRSGRGQEPALEHGLVPPLGFRTGVVVLTLAGVAAAFTSEWFVAAIDPAVQELGISKAFTGLVIVAIAGNAVENIVGIQLAWKRQYELSVSVVKNSVAQIAAFLYPALVLISLLFDQRLTFSLDGGVGLVLIVALALAALAIWQVTGDGEASGYEGWALVATYAILGTIVWFE